MAIWDAQKVHGTGLLNVLPVLGDSGGPDLDFEEAR
jgi:hypothetical protein